MSRVLHSSAGKTRRDRGILHTSSCEKARALRGIVVTYVITEPCIGIKDASCVEVCPVDCIHWEVDAPDSTTSTRPSASTAASARVCPVAAIFPEDAVPEECGSTSPRPTRPTSASKRPEEHASPPSLARASPGLAGAFALAAVAVALIRSRQQRSRLGVGRSATPLQAAPTLEPRHQCAVPAREGLPPAGQRLPSSSPRFATRSRRS